MSPKYVANSSPPENCRMAIPKKGRLYDKVSEMLKGAGIEYRREDRLDVALCKDLPLTIIFLPAKDIATYVGEGNIDIGITGIDCIEESEANVDKVLNLGFGKCKLCVQAQISKNIKDPEALAGGRVVTSFPNLTKQYFDPIDAKIGVKTQVKFVSGSVEAACGLGLADGVVDLVETGTTMRAAGLEVVADVLQTEVGRSPVCFSFYSSKSSRGNGISIIVTRFEFLCWLTSAMLIHLVPRASSNETGGTD